MLIFSSSQINSAATWIKWNFYLELSYEITLTKQDTAIPTQSYLPLLFVTAIFSYQQLLASIHNDKIETISILCVTFGCNATALTAIVYPCVTYI
jgi:hypothetical protein